MGRRNGVEVREEIRRTCKDKEPRFLRDSSVFILELAGSDRWWEIRNSARYIKVVL